MPRLGKRSVGTALIILLAVVVAAACSATGGKKAAAAAARTRAVARPATPTRRTTRST